jgi:hypothetical protein
MKIEYKNNWPVDSTRFLLPTIAFRGFRKGRRIVTLAMWTWQINFILSNAESSHGGKEPRPLNDAAELLAEIMRDEVNHQDEAEKWLRAYAPQYLANDQGHQSTAGKGLP